MAGQPRRQRPRPPLQLLLALVVCLGSSSLLVAVDAGASQCVAVKPTCPARAPPNPFAGKAAAATAAPKQQPAAAPPQQLLPQDVTASLLASLGVRKERMFVPQLAAQQQQLVRGRPATDMPQRVAPTANQAALSAAAQQQLFSQLVGVLQGPAAMARSSNSSSSKTRRLRPARRHRKAATASAAPMLVSSVHELQQEPGGEPGVVYLSNARLRVGVDTNRGGAITHLSSPVMPPEWADVNLVNTWDAGRLVQQSYYGCYDGSCWVDKPWRWNPVQGGSWQNGPPQLLASSVGAASVTTASVPRNWGGQELLDDVLMVTQTQLTPNVAKVRFTMRYTGSASHPEAHQEVPAVFAHRRLNVLAMYTGNAPWSGGELTFVLPGQTGEYYAPTERWAAYVDQASGFGLGVYSPISDQLVAYRVGPEGSAARSDVSYLAPLVTARIQPGTEFSYDVYLAAGRVDEMRAWFAEIAGGLAAQRPAPYIRAVEQPQQQQQQGASSSSSSSSSSARRPSFLMGQARPAVPSVPGGSHAVAFASSLPTPAEMQGVDALPKQPPASGVKVGSKPADLKPKPRRAPPPVKPAGQPPPPPAAGAKKVAVAAKPAGSAGGKKQQKERGGGTQKKQDAVPPKL